MTPVGYMYKTVSLRPEWLETDQVEDVYSVSACVSEDFCEDWINYWKHNGYWFFDSPSIMESIANEQAISLDGMKLFFYKMYEKQWDVDIGEWFEFEPEKEFVTDVLEPLESVVAGYDVVSYFCQTSSECSPLSCNHLAQERKVNRHCLLSNLDEAKGLIESGVLQDCEPGPYRIIEVQYVQAA